MYALTKGVCQILCVYMYIPLLVSTHFYYECTIKSFLFSPQECQAVRTELQRTVAEKESLSLKVQEYAQSLLRAEEAIAVKEREKSELVESYRALSEEADKLDSTVQVSLGENSATKLELSTIAQVT